MESIWKHYKGNEYVVTSIAIHTETGEKFVVYHPRTDPDKVWVRPYDMFHGMAYHEAGFMVKRFTQKYKEEL